MNTNETQWKDITETTRQTGPIGTVEFQVKQFGKWTLGYQWVVISIGGAPSTGLFLYAEKQGHEAKKRCVFSLKDAIGFFADLKAPAKGVAVVLNKAAQESKGGFSK